MRPLYVHQLNQSQLSIVDIIPILPNQLSKTSTRPKLIHILCAIIRLNGFQSTHKGCNDKFHLYHAGLTEQTLVSSVRLVAGRGRDSRLEMTDSPVRNKRPVKNYPECETSRYYIKTDNERSNYSWADQRSFVLQW